MAKDIVTNTFAGGMNKDMDYSIIPNNTYIHAENFKLISNENSNGLILENAEGNTELLDIDDITDIGYDWRIVGHCVIDKYLVLFVTENRENVDPDGGTGESAILRITIVDGKIQSSENIYKDSLTKGYLNFSVTYPIKAVGVYEAEDNIKVYWSDGYNEDRFVNIMDDISEYEVDMFSLLPDFPDVSSIGDARAEFVELVDGNLKASKIQYTYQYYNVNGAATKFAPLSPPILIPANNITQTPYAYMGGEEGEYTTVGCKLKINTPISKKFNRIRLVALDYNKVNDVPSVRVFGEYKLDTSDTNTYFNFSDVGNTIGEITYEDFLTYGNVIYKSKDSDVKDNVLFKANIQEETFDVDFDARAYRHNSSGVAKLYNDSELSTSIDVKDGAGGVYYDYTDVPEDHNCVNAYNDPDEEDDVAYIYQSNGITIGASGENVTIDFTTAYNESKTLIIDNLGKSGGDNFIYDADVGDNPADPYNAAYLNSFQRHEVYRLGVVFFNEKLQASPVKWINDFKIPTHYDDSINNRFSYASSDDTISNMAGLKVTLSNMPSEAFAWQVVMVKRNYEDRSVLANGILQTPTDGGATPSIHYLPSDPRSSTLHNTLTTETELNATNYTRQLMAFISPEINILKSLSFKSGDFLQYNGHFDYTNSTNSSKLSGQNRAGHKLNAFTPASDEYDPTDSSTHKAVLTDMKIVEQPSSPEDTSDIDNYEIQIGPYTYVPIVGNNVGSGTDFTGLHGTHVIAYSSLPINIEGYTSDVSYVTYRRNVFSSQYGGVDYYSRQRNEYYGISELKYTNSTVTTFEGDTTINYFHYLKQSTNLENDTNSWAGHLLFPVESTIYSDLRTDRDTMIFTSDSRLVREVAGNHDNGTSYYKQENDLYRYNTVYSFFGSAQVYLDTILDESDQTHYPNRVMYSDTKISNEIQDSFTIFRVNNFISVDGKYGPINNLINFNDTLFYWQDRAFGVLSVNTRALIQDNNPGILALGSAGVLDDYDYLSTSTGNINDFGIITTSKYIYWVDNYKNEIVKFEGRDRPLSKTSGLQSWINSNGKIGHVVAAYDSKYNDVLFTIRFANNLTCNSVSGDFGDTYTSTDLDLSDSTENNCIINARYYTDYPIVSTKNVIEYSSLTDDYSLSKDPYASVNSEFNVTTLETTDNAYTISFNEQLNKFVSFYSFKPEFYVNMHNYLLSSNDGTQLWLHNSEDANRCQYYGTYYDSVIRFAFNKNYPYTKVFDTVKWVSESVDSSNINIFKDTFDKVSFYNDWQHTGSRDLYYQHDNSDGLTRPVPISRRERTWSMQIPRDIVDTSVESNSDITDDTNWDATNGRLARIRDKYMISEFTYENDSNNYTFSVPFISSVYRLSYR